MIFLKNQTTMQLSAAAADNWNVFLTQQSSERMWPMFDLEKGQIFKINRNKASNNIFKN